MKLSKKNPLCAAQPLLQKGMSESTRAPTEIIIGAVLFIAGEILEHMGFGTAVTLPIYTVAYAVLGWKVI